MDAASDLHVIGQVPAFRSVLRGYDPDDVRVALDELRRSLAEVTREAEEQTERRRSAEQAHDDLQQALAMAQSRLAELELERHAAPTAAASYESLGARIEQILQVAVDEAADITGRAREEAQALSDEAQASAVTSRIETDHYASDVRAAALAEADTIRERAHLEADRLVADGRAMRENQQRAHAEAVERQTAELAERQARAETDMAQEATAHERQLAQLTAQIDSASVQLTQARERAEAEARAQREEVARLRRQVRQQLAEVRMRLVAALPDDAPAEPATPLSGPRRRPRARRRRPAGDAESAER